MNDKPWYLSKTIWVNFFMGMAMVLSQFIPSVSEFLQLHFSAVGDAWALINIALRFLTTKEIS